MEEVYPACVAERNRPMIDVTLSWTGFVSVIGILEHYQPLSRCSAPLADPGSTRPRSISACPSPSPTCLLLSTSTATGAAPRAGLRFLLRLRLGERDQIPPKPALGTSPHPESRWARPDRPAEPRPTPRRRC